MKDKKIDFIICTNDDRQFSEACLYINNLEIPQDFEINVLEIREASSIFSGYNEGMNASDAKYKIYMHHDVRIIDKMFLFTMLRRFQNRQVGMLGVVGSTRLTVQPWQWDAGVIAETRVNRTHCQRFSEVGIDKYVKQIDGLLMATQYDLPWREDLFDGWDVYDCSQCCEFLRAGYKIVVPSQNEPICLHDCGMIDLTGYDQARRKFITYYSDMFDRADK